jgi:uncharacterized Zn finger protein (UPF0148 family)
MDRFCGKCGARLDERTGVCPVCDPTADIINTVRSRAEEETVVPESDPVRQTAGPAGSAYGLLRTVRHSS